MSKCEAAWICEGKQLCTRGAEAEAEAWVEAVAEDFNDANAGRDS